MPNPVQKWLHTTRAGASVLRFGHHFPALREFGLAVIDSLSLFGCRLTTGKAIVETNRKTLLICLHAASISGAPILGFNLASRFSQRYNVVVILLSDGPLADDLTDVCVAIARPRYGSMRDTPSGLLARVLFSRIKRRFGLDFVIANSVECAVSVQAARMNAIPCLSLIHEFAEYAHPRRLSATLFGADRIIFSSEFAARSAEHTPGFDRDKLVILPQGRSEVPARADNRPFGSFLQRPIGKDDIICIGCGNVEMRKGTDLFISTAISAVRKNARLRFIWVGDGYKPESDIRFSFWLKEQIERSGFRDRIDIIPALSWPSLLNLYRTADMMFLSSRLDPLPNVAIDALHEGLPVVCFDRTTGLVEYVCTDPVLKNLVANHMDINALGGIVCQLANDKKLRKSASTRSRELSILLFDMNKYISTLEGHLADLLR